MDWFRGEPGHVRFPRPRAPANTSDPKAAIPTGCRVVTTERLARLREALERFTVGLADQDTFRNPARVSHLLVQLGFTPDAFLTRYTVAAVASRS
jgi:hypothetical protein